MKLRYVQRLQIAFAGLLVALSWCAFAASQWEFDGSIIVPAPNTLFLAMDSRGNLYATSFNSRPTQAEVFAMRIANPDQPKPQITIFDRYEVPAQRGYSGIACDAADNIYISLDAGEASPSFIRKFPPSLELDKTFGYDGVLASREIRVVGLAAHQDRVLAGVSWGRFCVLDSKGRFLGITPRPSTVAYIRDIVYVPRTRRVYGVDRDGLFVFHGGTLDNLSAYELVEVVEPGSLLKAGSGISYNKFTNELFYTDRSAGGITIFPLDGSPRGVITLAVDGRGAYEPADSVTSPDGRYLYVSDLRASQVVRYRYAGPSQVAATPTPASPPPSQASGAGPWLTDFDEALKLANRENKLVVAFFHSPLTPRSNFLNDSVFTSDFLKKFSEAVWVRIDASKSPTELTRFGVFKVPAVVLFDKTGQVLDRLMGDATQSQVAALIEKHRPRKKR
jgi:hypothetical protein